LLNAGEDENDVAAPGVETGAGLETTGSGVMVGVVAGGAMPVAGAPHLRLAPARAARTRQISLARSRSTAAASAAPPAATVTANAGR
jgi:hypothetical protein